MVLGLVGVVQRSDLDACKPNCSSDQIDGPRGFFVAGDVIGSTGILTLGVAAAVFFLGRGDAGMRATSIRAVPGRGGGFEVRF